MQVVLRVQVSGTRDGVAWPDPGESLEVSDAEGAQLIHAGIATDDADYTLAEPGPIVGSGGNLPVESEVDETEAEAEAEAEADVSSQG